MEHQRRDFLEALKKYAFVILLLLTAAIISVQLKNQLHKNARLYAFSENECESDKFREQCIDEESFVRCQRLAEQMGLDVYELMACEGYMKSYALTGQTHAFEDSARLEATLAQMKQTKPKELLDLSAAYAAIWKDLEYFPVAKASNVRGATVAYENNWMAERTYGGKRTHEGTDLMAAINRRGYYPIISMTKGTVENVGWLPQGGYRIGIRAPSGGYFYYAHLSGYSREYQVGDPVSAGEILGMMGDTGYSEIEGTTGMFPVHLHLGIYIKTKHQQELSVNPYYVLKFMEAHKRTYAFSDET